MAFSKMRSRSGGHGSLSTHRAESVSPSPIFNTNPVSAVQNNFVQFCMVQTVLIFYSHWTNTSNLLNLFPLQ
jgi:hypothetical protein